ncbi:MAG TPA: DUF5995 family protein [Polyangia bacterium]|nr:DUF5995 family protein [Polyangia bacterium]
MSVLAPILAATPIARVEDAVARMNAIAEVLPAADGIACFNKLYLEVTKSVLASLGQATFADPAFLTALDVNFANLYFGALSAFEAGSPATPRAWAPLFEARGSQTIAPLQFALAGMNAHINRDLPVALLQTFTATGLGPSGDSPEHADFERVNTLLAATEKQVKEDYLDGLTRTLDARFDGVDDVVAIWSVTAARDAAWTNGEVMWHLRGVGPVADAYLAALDRTVGFAARGLLVSTGTLARVA